MDEGKGYWSLPPPAGAIIYKIVQVPTFGKILFRFHFTVASCTKQLWV